MIYKRLLVLLVIVLTSNNLHAVIRLPSLFNNGMVLQRTKSIPVWGWGKPGEHISLTFKGRTYKTETKADGTWILNLKAMDAGGPYQMSVQGTDHTITIKDVMIGDVFVCSGQSNMEFTMNGLRERYAQEIAESTNPNIRQFLVANAISYTPLNDVKSIGWVAADPQSILKFTAVGYFFAKALYEKYHVPIGLIHSSWGGTPIESWMSIQALNDFPKYQQQAENVGGNMEHIKATEASMVKTWTQEAIRLEQSFDKNEAFGPTPGNIQWKNVSLPGTWKNELKPGNGNISWLKKEITVAASDAGKPALLFLGLIVEEDSTYVNGKKVGATNNKYYDRKYQVPAGVLKAGINYITVRAVSNYGPGSFVADRPYKLVLSEQIISLEGDWQYREVASLAPQASRPTIFQSQPTALFYGMIAPMTNYVIKGVIWYQGEANTWRAAEYRKLFPALITDWREKWKSPDLPFLFVQLSNYGALKSQPDESMWAELREAQFMTLSLKNTGMAVTHDIGDYKNIHPLNKLDVGKRLALAAEKVIYKENLVFSGPMYKSMKVEHDRIVIDFNHTGTGLVAKDNEELKYFSIAGADKKFVWANAKIEGNRVVVWSEAVPSPVAVRYAWAESANGSNLYNKEGLPASSFRTDHP